MSDIPQIACKSYDITAELGDHVTLSCDVRAFPAATVDWYFGDGNATLDNSTDADSWTVASRVRTPNNNYYDYYGHDPRNNPEQVVHTHVPLFTSSINWYRRKLQGAKQALHVTH